MWDLRRSRRVRFRPDPIIDGVVESLFAAQVTICCLHRNVPQKELNLFQFTTGLMAKTGASPAKVMRRERRNLTVQSFLLHKTPNDLGAKSGAQILPAFLIERRSVPVVIPAALVQASIPSFTQSGTGMVRMWPPLPTRSAMTRCSSLCCRSSMPKAVNSARRSPQPNRIAKVAWSRLARRLEPSAVNNNRLPC